MRRWPRTGRWRRVRAPFALGPTVGLAFLYAAGAGGLTAPQPAGPGATAHRAAEQPLIGHPVGALFRDGPPARVTGGFGEDSCHACHWEAAENEGTGALRVVGLPDVFEPGRTYRLAVELEHVGMSVAGFQMAMRHAADATGAGELTVPGSETRRVAVVTERDVQFAQHRLDGTVVAGEGATRWEVVWSAPSSGGRVLLHVAAVAGDGDESQMGDHVYTLEAAAEPPPEK
jgi:hypothetical protein